MYEPRQYREPWAMNLANTFQIARIMRVAQGQGGLIISYHGVISDHDWQDWETSDMVAESVFRQHLALYRKHYNVIPLRTMVAGLTGQEKLPPRALAITFDDGYRNNLTYAVPALIDYGMTATFFLTTGFLDDTEELWWLPIKRYVVMLQRGGGRDRSGVLGDILTGTRAEAGSSYREVLGRLKEVSSSERMDIVASARDALSQGVKPLDEVYAPLSWAEARALVEAGMEVGAHSVSHPILAHESDDRIAGEIREAVERVRSVLGVSSLAFSYPDGQLENCQQRIQTEVQGTGCYAGLLNVSGVNKVGDDVYRLRRFPVGGHHTALRLELDLCGLRALKARLAGAFKAG